MGCFNTTGFLSKLPILHGDRVVCFLGKININADVYGFTPYHVFSLVSPICLPIYGQYDDYGSIENIDDSLVKTLLENLTDVDCESLCNGIRDCGYSPIKYELEHWGYKNGKMPKDDWKKKRVEQILPILKLYKIETIPVLLFEHEDFYNKLTEGPATLTFWNDEKPQFDLFYESLDKYNELVKKFDLNVSGGPVFFGDRDRYGLRSLFWAIFDKRTKEVPEDSMTEEEMKTMMDEIEKEIDNGNFVNSLIYRGEQPDAFQVINNLSLDKFTKIMTECKDEARKAFKFYYTLSTMPMYVGLSKTAGEQSYSKNNINKFFDLLDEQRKKFNERVGEWDDEEEDEDV